MPRQKITVVGAGNVGATTAFIAANRRLGKIVLLDIVKGLPDGKALDMAEASPIRTVAAGRAGHHRLGRHRRQRSGGHHQRHARKPGMSRDDLLSINAGIVRDVSRKVAELSPNAAVIVVSNPLDVMVYVAGKTTGFAKNRVMGMAGELDSARFCCFLGQELGVNVEDIQCVLMGGHGDDMVPLPALPRLAAFPFPSL